MASFCLYLSNNFLREGKINERCSPYYRNVLFCGPPFRDFADCQIPFICSDNITADVDISSSKCQTLIISDQYYKKVGNDALISFAKTLRASQICAVSENQPEFGITSELGGKMIFLRLPIQESENISEDYGLQMLATLVSIQALLRQVTKVVKNYSNWQGVANTDVTVFINGPTGTGKEVLSKFIHNNSKRNEAGFIAVNCAAIPENMLEAILFGYEKGSFTGASTTNKGILELRTVEHYYWTKSQRCQFLYRQNYCSLTRKICYANGSQTSIPVDVRVIATTNRNMVEEIRNGNFRRFILPIKCFSSFHIKPG